MSGPRVSVITIFYDTERFIAEAIQSVIDQTVRDWELLLVDDGSRDGSTAIAPEKLAEQIALMDRVPAADMLAGATLVWHGWTAGGPEDLAKDHVIEVGVPHELPVEQPIAPPHLHTLMYPTSWSSIGLASICPAGPGATIANSAKTT
jgi:hypothetical protein